MLAADFNPAVISVLRIVAIGRSEPLADGAVRHRRVTTRYCRLRVAAPWQPRMTRRAVIYYAGSLLAALKTYTKRVPPRSQKAANTEGISKSPRRW